MPHVAAFVCATTLSLHDHNAACCSWRVRYNTAVVREGRELLALKIDRRAVRRVRTTKQATAAL
jgi:hypothetical protein